MTRMLLSLAVSVGIALSSNNFAEAANITSGSALFSEGVTAYQSRHYAEALSKFTELVKNGQGGEMVHYYMALCYQGLNQIAKAKAEYSLVSASARDPALRVNAQQGLNSIERWSQHRSYQGNGNYFQRNSMISSRSGAWGRPMGAGASAFNGGTPNGIPGPDCPPSG